MSETLHDFEDGRGPVPAHRHTNPDGTLGGWVAETATVEPTVHVAENAQVFGNAHVSGNTQLFDNAHVFENARIYGNIRVSGNARIFENALLNGDFWISGNALIDGNAMIYNFVENIRNRGSNAGPVGIGLRRAIRQKLDRLRNSDGRQVGWTPPSS